MVLFWSVSRYSISYPIEFSLHCISHGDGKNSFSILIDSYTTTLKLLSALRAEENLLIIKPSQFSGRQDIQSLVP